MQIRIAAPYPAPSVQFDTALPSQLPASVPLPQAWIAQINTLAQHASILPKPSSSNEHQARSSLEFSRTRREDLFSDEGDELPPDYITCSQTNEQETEADDLLPYPAAVHALDRAAALSSLLKSIEFELYSSPAPSPTSPYATEFDYDTGNAFDYNMCTARIALSDDSSAAPPSPESGIVPALTLSLPRACAQALARVVTDVAESGHWDTEARRRRERERERERNGHEDGSDQQGSINGGRGRSKQRGRARTRSVSEAPRQTASAEIERPSPTVDEGDIERAEEDGDSDSLRRKGGKKTWHRRARSLSVVGMGLVNFFGSIVESLSRPSSPPPSPDPSPDEASAPTLMRTASLSRNSKGTDDTMDPKKHRPAHLVHARARSTSSLPNAASLLPSTIPLPSRSPLPNTNNQIISPSHKVVFHHNETEVDPRARSRALKRQARAGLLDAFRQFVVPAINNAFVGWLGYVSSESNCRYLPRLSIPIPMACGLQEFASGFPVRSEGMGMFEILEGLNLGAEGYANNGPWREGGYALWVLGLALRKVGREAGDVQRALECEQKRLWERQLELQRQQSHRQALESQMGYGVTRIGGGAEMPGEMGIGKGVGGRHVSPSELDECPFVSDSDSLNDQKDEAGGDPGVDADDASTSTETDGSSVHTPQETYVFGEVVVTDNGEVGIDDRNIGMAVDELELVAKGNVEGTGERGRKHRRSKRELAAQEGELLPNPYEAEPQSLQRNNCAPLLSPFISPNSQRPVSLISSITPLHSSQQNQTQVPALTNRLTYLSSLQRSLTSLVSSSLSILTHAASERAAQLAVLEVRARRRAWSVGRLGGRAEARYAGSLGRPGAGSALKETWSAREDDVDSEDEREEAHARMEYVTAKAKKTKKKSKKGRKKEMEKMECISEDEEDEFEFDLEVELVTSPSPLLSSAPSSSHSREKSFDGPRDVSPPLSPNQVPFPTTPEPEVLDDFDDEVACDAPAVSFAAPVSEVKNDQSEITVGGEGEDFCSTGPQDTLPLFGGPVESESDCELELGFGAGCEFDECHGKGCGGCDAFGDEQDADAGCGFLPFSRSSRSHQTYGYGNVDDSKRVKKRDVDPLDVDIEAQAGFEWPYAYTTDGAVGQVDPSVGYAYSGYNTYTYGTGRGHGAGMYQPSPSSSSTTSSTLSPSLSPSSSTPTATGSASAPCTISVSTGDEFTLALDVPFYAAQIVRRTPRGRGHRRAVTVASFVPPS